MHAARWGAVECLYVRRYYGRKWFSGTSILNPFFPFGKVHPKSAGTRSGEGIEAPLSNGRGPRCGHPPVTYDT